MAARCPAPGRMWGSDAVRLALSTLCMALSGPALGETPMTGAEFAAHVGTGTVSYAYSSGARGVADYGPDRSVLWAFEGEDCKTGFWFEVGDRLCFVFADDALSACWHFTLRDGRLHGVSTFLGPDTRTAVEIFEVSHSDQPMVCPAPNA
jgi:hypothetical protein